MSMARLRSRWHNKSAPKSIETIASVAGMNIWKMASGCATKMYNDGFNFKSNAQLIDFISELAVFLLQLADRKVYEMVDEEQRGRFTQALAKHLINTVVENQVEELKGDPVVYREAIIDKLNQRLEGYAEFAASNGEPSYPMLRYFGSLCDEVLGGEDNKWVIEHVMEVEAPPLVKQLGQNLESLLAPKEDEPAAQ